MEWFGLVHHIRAKEGSDFGLAGLGSGRFGLLRGEFFFSSSYHERNECVDGLIFFFPSPPLVSGRGNSGFLREVSSTWIN